MIATGPATAARMAINGETTAAILIKVSKVSLRHGGRSTTHYLLDSMVSRSYQCLYRLLAAIAIHGDSAAVPFWWPEAYGLCLGLLRKEMLQTVQCFIEARRQRRICASAASQADYTNVRLREARSAVYSSS